MTIGRRLLLRLAGPAALGITVVAVVHGTFTLPIRLTLLLCWWGSWGLAVIQVAATLALLERNLPGRPENSSARPSGFYVTCPDTVTYDWATATLKDNTGGTTSTPLDKTCTNGAGWKQITAAVTAGRSYTLTLSSHDDNYAGDATYTLYDDVTLSGSTPPPPGLTQISSDPYSTASTQHTTAAAPDTFAWSNTMVAATQVGRYSDGGADNIGWATSADSGTTWQQGFLPGITTAASGQRARVSDPSAAYDAKHGTWLASGLFIDSAVNGRGVPSSRSADGLTWSNPVIAARNNSASYDKEWIACDNTASSPH
ncbi:hypothetical protein OHS18_13055 [Amycolatopsis sp. NBC_00355]|uniref:hypothetical protein n=1 Tax=Amycolatopsis sp. NBC_00355 TaxID=2975957 RepID=UPI002E25DC8E